MALNNAVAGYWILFGSKAIGHLGVDFMLGVQQGSSAASRALGHYTVYDLTFIYWIIEWELVANIK